MTSARGRAHAIIESVLGGHTLAFDAAVVSGVRHHDASPLLRPLVDVAAVFGMESPQLERRSVLTLEGASTFDVLVGTAVAFREVRAGSLLRLPQLVAALGPQCAVMGLVARERGYSLLMDTRGLQRWASGGGIPG